MLPCWQSKRYKGKEVARMKPSGMRGTVPPFVADYAALHPGTVLLPAASCSNQQAVSIGTRRA